MTYDNDNEPAYPSYPKFIHRKHNKGIDLIIYKAEQIGTFMFSVLPCYERKRVAQFIVVVQSIVARCYIHNFGVVMIQL